MFNINDIMDDEKYYKWMVDAAFNMLSDETDYIEFYTRHKSRYIHDNIDEDVFHDVLVGRLSFHDAYMVMGSLLKIVKDADVGDYRMDSVSGVHGIVSVDLSGVVFLRFPERFY